MSVAWRIIYGMKSYRPDPMTTSSKGWVCGDSFAEIEGSNPAAGTDLSIVVVVCCQSEVSATGRSLDRRGPTECLSLTVKY